LMKHLRRNKYFSDFFEIVHPREQLFIWECIQFNWSEICKQSDAMWKRVLTLCHLTAGRGQVMVQTCWPWNLTASLRLGHGSNILTMPPQNQPKVRSWFKHPDHMPPHSRPKVMSCFKLSWPCATSQTILTSCHLTSDQRSGNVGLFTHQASREWFTLTIFKEWFPVKSSLTSFICCSPAIFFIYQKDCMRKVFLRITGLKPTSNSLQASSCFPTYNWPQTHFKQS
jgi:hypothetical protein